jgi:membrane fusion protein, multidrug efflux system
MHTTRRWMILGLACAALAALPACRQEPAPEPQAIRPVRAVVIPDAPTASYRTFPGRARAAKEVTLAFEVAGRITQFPVAVGDIVREGAVLVALDPRDFENTLSAARSEVVRAKAQYERVKRAAALNAVSRQDLSDAQAAYESAQATVSIREKALEDSVLRAPYDAVVVATFFQNFETVQPKQPVVRLVNPTQVEMVVEIPEDLIAQAQMGGAVVASFDALPGREIPGVVTEIGAEASQATRTFPVTVLMDQPQEAKILPGMAGRAWSARAAAGSAQAGFLVPMTALYTGKDGAPGSFVWVIAGARGPGEVGTVARRAVQTGAVERGGVRVTGGLSGGEVVATAGVSLLQEGQQVRVVE